ncbi:unnamed protein product [Dicrocoelium dendriticum]|nr:unnamed protein product [Dicrocoelium dendriticum]
MVESALHTDALVPNGVLTQKQLTFASGTFNPSEGVRGERCKLKSALKRRRQSAEWDRYSLLDRSSWFKSQMSCAPPVTRYSPNWSILSSMKYHPVKQTSSFKNTGRRSDVYSSYGTGRLLLPGAYNLQEWEEKRNPCLRTFSFKNRPRIFEDMYFGLADKTLKTAPGLYNPHSLGSDDRSGVHHAVFKSKSLRLFTRMTAVVPGPGSYDPPTHVFI